MNFSNRFVFSLALSMTVFIGMESSIPGLSATEWYLLKSNGRTIAQVAINTHRVRQGASLGSETEVVNQSQFLRDGEPFAMESVSHFVEDADGNALTFTHAYSIGEQRLLEAQGQFSKNALSVQMSGTQAQSTRQTPLERHNFHFPAGRGLEKLYQQHFTDREGSRFGFQSLSLSNRPELINTDVTVLGLEAFADDSGTPPTKARKYQLKNAPNPAATNTKPLPAQTANIVTEWRNAHGQLLKAQSGNPSHMDMVRVSRRAVREAGPVTLDIVHDSEILTQKIDQPRLATEAVYRITPIVGDPVNLQALLPASGMQALIATPAGKESAEHPQSVYLKVAQSDPATLLGEYPTPFSQQYLQSTPYLQADDPQIVQTAAAVAGDEKRTWFAARRLQQWVYQNITEKNLTLGFGSAKETLVQRHGDCTEHAVLLAALTRALGIPSRVAVGLIYLPSAESLTGKFVYHMWTEVYVADGKQPGQWVDLDATNPQEIPDATHIKIADSALSDSSDLESLTDTVVGAMGHIQVEVLSALSPADSRLALGNGNPNRTTSLGDPDLDLIDIAALSRDSILYFQVKADEEALSLDTVDGQFNRGVRLLSQGDYTAAQQAFVTSLGKVRQPTQMYRMAQELAALELYPLARQAFASAANGAPGLAARTEYWNRAMLPVAELSPTAQAQYAVALHALNQQTDNNPGHTRLIDLGRRNTGASAEAFQAIIAENSGFTPAYRALASLEKGPDALALLERAALMEPDHCLAWEAVADAQLNNKQYAEAAANYKKAVDLLKDTAIAHDNVWDIRLRAKLNIADGAAKVNAHRRDATGWTQIGHGLLLQDRFSNAARAYHNALIIAPSDADALTGDFQVAMSQNDWTRIGQRTRKLQALVPKNATAGRLYAQYQVRLRDYDKALDTLHTAINLDPANPDGWLQLSSVYERMIDRQNSLKPLPGTLVLPKRAVTPHKAAAHSTHPSTIKATKPSPPKPSNQAMAEGVLQEALNQVTVGADHDRVAVQLASVILKRKGYDEAIALAQPALTLDPLNASASSTLGLAQFMSGDLDTAKATLEGTLAVRPKDITALLYLGRIAEQRGQESLAMTHYQKAYQSAPFDKSVSVAYRTLSLKYVGRYRAIKPFLYLNPDEHFYVVQLLRGYQRLLNNVSIFSQNQTSLKLGIGSDSKAKSSLAGKEFTASLTSMLGILKSLDADTRANYQILESMQVPTRFLALHLEIIDLMRYQMRMNQVFLPFFLSDPLITKADYGMEWNDNVDPFNNLHKTLLLNWTQLAHTLPESELTGLMNEAGLSQSSVLMQVIQADAQNERQQETISRTPAIKPNTSAPELPSPNDKSNAPPPAKDKSHP